jgi:outer membrane protein assembly factor BamE
MEVQQGNALTNESVAQLKRGMSKDEVVSIIGTPLMQDNFRSNRWDYVYYTKKGRSSSKRQGITLLFQGDNLLSVVQ